MFAVIAAVGAGLWGTVLVLGSVAPVPPTAHRAWARMILIGSTSAMSVTVLATVWLVMSWV